MRNYSIYSILLICMMFVCACSKREVKSRMGLYYWKTSIAWSDAESQWADSSKMESLYLRLFDVIRDGREQELGLRPEASLRFGDEGLGERLKKSFHRIIPVVFLAPDVITRNDETKMPMLASLLLKRIDQMTERNGIGKCEEIQIDFDWAQSNGQVYFGLLRQLADSLHKEGRKLSTTIRLHQLALQVPPVDRGVLMCYNTGKIQQMDEKNSILSKAGVEPYLRYLKDYDLPLSLALPDFGWNVVFREEKFAFIAPGLVLSDTASFAKIDDTHFRARTYQAVPGAASATTQSNQRILPGDVIRREDSNEQLNREILETLCDIRPEIGEEVIVFRN